MQVSLSFPLVSVVRLIRMKRRRDWIDAITALNYICLLEHVTDTLLKLLF